MKLIIAGTRTFSDVEKMYAELDHYIPYVTEVVSGHARGADQMGEMWAHEYNIDVKIFPADWKQYGRIAGFIRNEQMAEYADEAVVFWDGKSPGTYNMIAQMRKRNKPTKIIKYETHEKQSV